MPVGKKTEVNQAAEKKNAAANFRRDFHLFFEFSFFFLSIYRTTDRNRTPNEIKEKIFTRMC